jgi:hypothetical protein
LNVPKNSIKAGRFIFDEMGAWSEHQPPTQEENDRHLGINDEKAEYQASKLGAAAD